MTKLIQFIKSLFSSSTEREQTPSEIEKEYINAKARYVEARKKMKNVKRMN
jgi:hypothetical protein